MQRNGESSEKETANKIQSETLKNPIQNWIVQISDGISKIKTENKIIKNNLEKCRLELATLLQQEPADHDHSPVAFAQDIIRQVVFQIKALYVALANTTGLDVLDVKSELISTLETQGIFHYRKPEPESKNYDDDIHFTLDYESDFLKSKAGVEMSADPNPTNKDYFEKFCKARTNYLALVSKLNDKSTKLHQRETAREAKTAFSKFRLAFKSKNAARSDHLKKDLADNLSKELKTKSLKELKRRLSNFRIEVARIPKSALFPHLFSQKTKSDDVILASKNPATRDLVPCIIKTVNELIPLIDKLQFKAPLPENSPYVTSEPDASTELKHAMNLMM